MPFMVDDDDVEFDADVDVEERLFSAIRYLLALLASAMISMLSISSFLFGLRFRRSSSKYESRLDKVQ